jgi:hypothetical protein
MHLRFVLPPVLALAAAASCSSGTVTPPPPAYQPPPASVVLDDPGAVKIRREVFVVDTPAPPPNPKAGRGTPTEQNRVRVVRYRVDADPPKPARAVVVMMPGFLGGAGSLDGVARALVRRSREGDALEAWAIDRRSNLLEDTHGLDVAEVRGDTNVARRYYFDGETVEGRTFEGFLAGAALPWASEWGLATTLADLRSVVQLVPAAERPTRVILLGHSLGGAIVESYAAWDFGTPGYQELAGLVLVDGVAGKEGAGVSPIDQTTYEQGGTMGAFGPQPGLEKDIRAGLTFFTLPFLGTKALAVSEYVAMDARRRPRDVVEDATRDGLLAVLLGQSPLPKMTNRAVFGFAFDDTSCGLQIAAVSCGAGTGGAITEYVSVFGGKLRHPSDPAATYDWVEVAATMPAEATSIDDAARAWFEGPGLNFSEWYFPTRLSLDVGAAVTLDIADSDWRSAVHGLRAKHGAAIDVPVLAVGSVVAKGADYEVARGFFAPIGAGRPAAGTPRTDPRAFRVIEEPTLTHIDWIVGTDRPGSPVAAWYEALAAFARDATPAGGVVVPIR